MEENLIPLVRQTTNDFVILGQQVYFGDCLILDLENMEQSIGWAEKAEGGSSRHFSEIYTDGGQLYGILNTVGSRNLASTGRFVKIEIADHTEEAIMVQWGSVMVEQLRYEFCVTPLCE